MLTELMASLADQSLHQKLKHYISPEILLIDELGFDRLSNKTAKMPRCSSSHRRRYCKGRRFSQRTSTLRTSGITRRPVVTTAIVDRMVHHSIILHIQGPAGECTNQRNSIPRPEKQNPNLTPSRSYRTRIRRTNEMENLTEAQTAWILWNLHERLNTLLWDVRKGVPRLGDG